MDLIFDTNALSAFGDGDQALVAKLDRVSQICVPVVVLGEYRYGISLSKYRKTYEKWLNAALGDFTVLPIWDETATRYASICRQLRKAGTPLPSNDIWISALALEHDLPVVTLDQHFEKVNGLSVWTW